MPDNAYKPTLSEIGRELGAIVSEMYIHSIGNNLGRIGAAAEDISGRVGATAGEVLGYAGNSLKTAGIALVETGKYFVKNVGGFSLIPFAAPTGNRILRDFGPPVGELNSAENFGFAVGTSLGLTSGLLVFAAETSVIVYAIINNGILKFL